MGLYTMYWTGSVVVENYDSTKVKEMIFKKHGCTLIVTHDYAKLILMLTQFRFDAYFVDINLLVGGLRNSRGYCFQFSIKIRFNQRRNS